MKIIERKVSAGDREIFDLESSSPGRCYGTSPTTGEGPRESTVWFHWDGRAIWFIGGTSFPENLGRNPDAHRRRGLGPGVRVQPARRAPRPGGGPRVRHRVARTIFGSIAAPTRRLGPPVPGGHRGGDRRAVDPVHARDGDCAINPTNPQGRDCNVDPILLECERRNHHELRPNGSIGVESERRAAGRESGEMSEMGESDRKPSVAMPPKRTCVRSWNCSPESRVRWMPRRPRGDRGTTPRRVLLHTTRGRESSSPRSTDRPIGLATYFRHSQPTWQSRGSGSTISYVREEYRSRGVGKP